MPWRGHEPSFRHRIVVLMLMMWASLMKWGPLSSLLSSPVSSDETGPGPVCRCGVWQFTFLEITCDGNAPDNNVDIAD